MKWPYVPLGDVISYRKEFVYIEPDVVYSRCRVRTSARGIVLRDRVPGSHIRTKRQQVCRAGEFLVAEIDAKVGGYGIVPSNLDGAIVSGHYFVFEVDKNHLDQRFLGWYCRTTEFMGQVKARGSTNYSAIRPYDVLEYRVPLPTLTKQKMVADELDKIALSINKRNRLAESAICEARSLLSSLFRGAVDHTPRLPLREVAPLVRRPIQIDLDCSYPELGVRSFGRGTFHKPPISGTDVGSKRLYSIHQDDLVFNIVFAWEGAVAVAQREDDGRVGSHRFLTCVPKPKIASSQFLLFYFLTPEGIEKLGNASPGGAGRNRTLGLKKLDAIDVPVPDLERQEWFCRLYSRYREMTTMEDGVQRDMDRLMSAMVHKRISIDAT